VSVTYMHAAETVFAATASDKHLRADVPHACCRCTRTGVELGDVGVGETILCH
jgi:hypothetical protein